MRKKALQLRFDVRDSINSESTEEKIKILAATNFTVVRGGGNVPWPEPPPHK